MIGVNLLPIARQTRAALVRHAIAGGALTLIAAFAAAAAILVLRDGVADAREYESRLVRVSQSAAAAKSDLESLWADRRRLEDLWKTTRLLAEAPDWGVLLGVVASARTEDILLERCALTPLAGAGNANAETPPDRFSLTLIGAGKSPDSVLNFALALHKTGVFARVEPPETKPGLFKGEEVSSFKLICALGPTPKQAQVEATP